MVHGCRRRLGQPFITETIGRATNLAAEGCRECNPSRYTLLLVNTGARLNATLYTN